MEYERYFNNIHKQYIVNEPQVSYENIVLQSMLLTFNVLGIVALLGFAFDWFVDPVAEKLREKVKALEAELDNTENTLDVLNDELEEKDEKIRLLESKLENLRDVLTQSEDDDVEIVEDTQG